LKSRKGRIEEREGGELKKKIKRRGLKNKEERIKEGVVWRPDLRHCSGFPSSSRKGREYNEFFS